MSAFSSSPSPLVHPLFIELDASLSRRARLAVEFQDVVHSRNPNHGRLVIERRVWPMPVVVMDGWLESGLAQGR